MPSHAGTDGEPEPVDKYDGFTFIDVDPARLAWVEAQLEKLGRDRPTDDGEIPPPR